MKISQQTTDLKRNKLPTAVIVASCAILLSTVSARSTYYQLPGEYQAASVEGNSIVFGSMVPTYSEFIPGDRESINVGNQIASERGRGNVLTGVAFSPNKELVVTTTGWVPHDVDNLEFVLEDSPPQQTPGVGRGRVEVWVVQTARRKALLIHPAMATHGGTDFYDVSYSPNSTLISAIGTHHIWLWDARSYKFLRRIPRSKNASVLTFSPDEKYLLSEGTIHHRPFGPTLIWNITTGQLRCKLEGKGYQFVFSDDGLIVVGDLPKETVENREDVKGIWSTETGKLLHVVDLPDWNFWTFNQS